MSVIYILKAYVVNFQNSHIFALVAMATLLALLLAKRGNGRNSKTKHRFDKIVGTDAKLMCVYKTMSLDF